MVRIQITIMSPSFIRRTDTSLLFFMFTPSLLLLPVLLLLIIIQLIFINMLSEQLDDQLQKHNTETQITKDNTQNTYETIKTNNRILKSLITHYN
jgi:hypothetical protein